MGRTWGSGASKEGSLSLLQQSKEGRFLAPAEQGRTVNPWREMLAAQGTEVDSAQERKATTKHLEQMWPGASLWADEEGGHVQPRSSWG